MKKRVGVWIRVSTKHQQQSDSPEHHLQKAKMYAELKDWEIVEEYHLEAVSGKSVIEHHEAQRMLRDIQSGHVEGLIFSKIARFARNVKELLEFSEHFQKYKADMISLSESIDTSTPSGRFFFTMISAMGQWERENIVERIKSSVEVRAKMGKVMGGIPFGYKRVGKDDMALDEHEAPIRKMMFDLFLEHKRHATVANILNEKGYRTKRKSKFSGTTVKRLLQDPTAKGIRRSHCTKIDENGRTVMRDQSEWYIHEAPRIVSDEVWDEVNDIIRKQEKEKVQPLNKKVHLFTSYLFCECGGGMYVPSSNPKYTCKKCKRKIHVDDIEAIFKEQLTEFIISEEEVNRYFDGTHTIIREKEQEIENVNSEIQKLETKIEKLFELHEQGQIDTERFKDFYDKPNSQVQQLKLRIPRIEGEIYALKDQFKSSGYIIEEARSLYENWDKLSKQQKRNIIEIITEKIVVSEQELNITLNYILPKTPSLKTTASGTHGLYSMSTICSFKLKPKLRKIPKAKPFTHSLGEYIRHERLKKQISQESLAKQLGVNGVALSMWELKRKPVHPKHFQLVIDFLGYVPNKSSKFDKLGTRTQLWRLQNNVSIKEFSELVNVPIEEITWIETARYCKIDIKVSKVINSIIKAPISFHAMLS